MSDYLLEVENLKVHFPVGRGFHKNKNSESSRWGQFSSSKKEKPLGIVGESGCGKSNLRKQHHSSSDPDGGTHSL